MWEDTDISRFYQDFSISSRGISLGIRMSKSSVSVSKNPTPLPAKSAWSRGPPTLPSPRSQSPALPSDTPIHQTHSRRPSALGQAVPMPRSNVGAVTPGQALIVFCALMYVPLNVIPPF